MGDGKTGHEVWTISVRAIGKGPPVALRVRSLLKTMLRGFGLRAVDLRRFVEDTTPAHQATELSPKEKPK